MLMKLGPMCFYSIKTLSNNFQQHSNNITTPCLCNFHKASVLIILKKSSWSSWTGGGNDLSVGQGSMTGATRMKDL